MTSASSTPAIATPTTSTPTSRPGTPLSTPPTTAVSDKPQDDSSKLKLFLSLLRKFIGVADISAVRFSLPAQLIEPIPNLGMYPLSSLVVLANETAEFTQYIDRPETFAAIGKSEDEIGRMLEVLRFWFTKDLKYVKGKPIKPYNSVLGEFFRCNWEVNEEAPPISTPKKAPPQPPPDPMVPTDKHHSVRISYITEQTSHHPPISAYYVDCPDRGIHAQGYDHINAKFTGSSVRVTPAGYNQGIFVSLTKRDEEYRMTHPAAYLSGLLKGSLYISVSDTCYVTCAKTQLKAILQYEETGWAFRSQNKVTGVIYKYDPENDKYTRLKDVPDDKALVRIEGVWQEQVYYWFPSGDSKSDKNGSAQSEKQLLIDLVPLMPVPKICPPPEEQLPSESRTFWKDLTIALQEKRFGDANKVKQDIEQKQRDKAAERKVQNLEWKPRFFTEVAEDGGQPHLSEEGKAALHGLQKKSFILKPDVTMA